jgi:preprotein translocase subunit SecD
MNKKLLWRGLFIVGLIAVAIVSLYPPKKKLRLGLDLQGGMHLALKVNTDDALRSEVDKDMERMRQELMGNGSPNATTIRTSDTAFEITGVAPDQDGVVGKAANDYLTGWDWNRSNDRLRFEMTASNVKQIRELSVQQALQTIRNRIDEFGVSEPTIARQGLDSDRIVVQLPGVDDPERVKRLIKNTAFLEFRLVDFPPAGSEGVDTREAVLQHYSGQLPEAIEILPGDVRDRQGRSIGQRFYGVEKRRVVTGRELKNARPGLGQFNEPVVHFSFSAEGAKLFGDATGQNVGRGLAIVLDGKVVSAPRINSRITDSGIIEGRFTQKEAEDLSAVLRSGALPAGITTLEERTVGPSLGADSIRDGLRAGGVGAVLVILCMLIFYRGAGVNAVLALLINLLLIFGALAALGSTLTLPGIAGIVLTIGMAVDANVLVFERIKEELRAGRTVRSAIDAGFTHALTAIIDAHVAALIAALFLFQFGSGPVRGFAVTLSIGIIGTVFTAVWVSHWLFDVEHSRRERVETLSI